MSTLISSYCSCAVCKQVRNKQPKPYRYIKSIQRFIKCSSCFPNRKLIINEQQTYSSINQNRISKITFRDIDIINKHCSKHDVMLKPSRKNVSHMKNAELRQRVKDANIRWRRLSLLPTNLIDLLFNDKEFIPLCNICYENVSSLTLNLCHRCIAVLINYQQRLEEIVRLQSVTFNDADMSSDYSSDGGVLEDIRQLFLDTKEDKSI